ncbi:hypothetical protein QQ054_21565 [Oscillatoria amoena NRMC-F 0135]|nr:hypothetical protein [Oscillatoria amoena NRMC-F 0135]
MRRFISILLLTLLLANFVGPYSFFAYRAIQIKQQMRGLLATLPDEDLELIILTPVQFKQARVEDHEIRINGHMFDIARVVERNSKLFVYGVYDEDEDSLLAFLDSVLLRLQNDSAQPPASVSAFALLQFIGVEFNFQVLDPQPDCPGETPYLQNKFWVILDRDAPPPRAHTTPSLFG